MMRLVAKYIWNDTDNHSIDVSMNTMMNDTIGRFLTTKERELNNCGFSTNLPAIPLFVPSPINRVGTHVPGLYIEGGQSRCFSVMRGMVR
jgi:hypothetical protein